MPKGKKVIWTNELIQDLIEKYKSGITVENLEKIFHTRKVSKILKDNGVEIKKGGARPNSGPKRKYSVNENYFEQIDSKDKAYFLGFIYADGYIFNRRSRKLGQNLLSICQQEPEPLEKFKKYINCNKPLQKFKVQNKKSISIAYKIDIISDKIYSNLLQYGVTERKSLTLTFPKNLEEKLIPHFIRGYFDGDGTVCVSSNRLNCGFSGTFEMLNSIRSKLNFLDQNKHLYKDNRVETNCWQLFFAKQLDTYEFYKYLYNDCGDLYLTRKKEVFDKWFKDKDSTTIITNPVKD